MISAVNYGIAKDSQVAPLKAENAYADRETGKGATFNLPVTLPAITAGNNLIYP